MPRRLAAFLALPVLLLCQCAWAAPLTPEEAKAQADKSEVQLKGAEYTALIEAQGALASKAFPACAAQAGPPPDQFTVVVEMGADARVANSWVLGESPFAQCFREAMAYGFVYRAPVTPFFTSFAYTRNKKPQ